MLDPLRLLLLEDNPLDADLATRELRKAGLQFDLQCVDTEATFTEQCQAHRPDLILSDFSLPAFDGFAALEIAKQVCPDVPFIFVSGVMGEENAIDSLRHGATDYVLKQRLARLAPAVTRALHESQERRALARAEQELAQSQARMVEIVESIRDGLFTLDHAWRFAYVNHRAAEIMGVAAEQLIGKNLWEQFPEIIGTAQETHYRQALNEGVPTDFETQVARTAASYDVRVYPSDEGLSVYWIDVTERKRAEKKLQQLNRTLRALSNINQALIRANSETEYVQAVCNIIIHDCGHAMTWIGYAEDDAEKSVTPVAYAGFEEGYLETLRVTWADTERGRGPTGTAIRTGQIARCHNMLTDPQFLPWRAEALRRGYASSIALPMIAEGKTFGALTIYSREPDPFSEDEIHLLSELTGDLTYGVNMLRLRAAHAQAEQQLRELSQRLSYHVDHSPLAVIEWGPDMRLTRWAGEAERLFGWKAEEVLGKRMEDFRWIYQEDQALVAEVSVDLQTGAHPRRFSANRNYCKDGSVVNCEWYNSSLIDESGKLRSILSLVLDVTARKKAEEALCERAQRDADLAYIAQTISHAGFHLQAVFDAVARRIGETFGDMCDVTLLSEDKQWLRPRASFHPVPAITKTLRDLFPNVPYPVTRTITGQVALTDQPLLLKHVTDKLGHPSILREYLPLIDRAGLDSLLIVPMSTDGNVLGTLAVARYKSQEPFNEQDLAFLQSIANGMALAIANARLYQQVEDARAVLEDRVRERTESERQQRLLAETLRDASAAFSQSLDLNTVSQTLLDYLAQNIQYDSADVILIDEANKAHLHATRGMTCVSESPDTGFDLAKVPILRNLINRGTSRLIADVRELADWSTWYASDQIVSWLGIPLKANNVVIGIFSLHKNQPTFFTGEHLRLAEALALPAAVSIQNALLYSKVAEAHSQLRTLSRQLMDAQENERREVARELHDEIGQVLTAVRTNLQVLRLTLSDAALNRNLDDSMAIVDHAVEEVRSLSLNLRPSMLDEFGLVVALGWYLERQAERTGLEIQFHTDPHEFRLPAALETTCFRIVQAALTNVVRHAKATQAQVVVRVLSAQAMGFASDQCEVTVCDNGVGFDVSSAQDRAIRGDSMGLLSMQERARLAGGQFEIKSAPGGGTEVYMRLPVVEE